MTVWVYVPLLLSILLSTVARPLARRLSPRTLTPALITAAGLAAAASTWGLVLLSATLLHNVSPVAEQSADRNLSQTEPVPVLVAVSASAILGVGVYRLTVTVGRRRSAHRALRGLCDASAAEELVVIAAAEPHAVAVPGRPGRRGRILVTSGMLAALDDDGRAVLLAHERAHLRGGHHRQRAIVDSAAALNPLLLSVRDTVAFLVERCADEVAAEAVGSRLLTARSLARAALATTDAQRQEAVAFERLEVTTRVAALQVAAPPHRHLASFGVVLLGVTATLAAADATLAFVAFAERLFPGRL